jgi:hypothetical protein
MLHHSINDGIKKVPEVQSLQDKIDYRRNNLINGMELLINGYE